MEDAVVKVFSNGMVDLDAFVDISEQECRELGLTEKVSFKVLCEILEQVGEDDPETLRQALVERMDDLIPKHIIVDDVFASFNYLICLSYDIGTTDDIDHLGNRRIRSVGELLQNQFRIGLSRMERVIRERMTTQNLDIITPQALINIRPVVASIKEFFGSSPLSQFMDQTNPLADVTHKRRLSALGPGGLSRDRAGFEVRDVHYTHYGRMCPIETPEGPNIGLISYLSTYARINEYGFIEAPYRRVDKETGRVTNEVVYMTADMEDEYIVAQASEPLDEEMRFVNRRVAARHRDEILEIDRERIDFMDISPRMVVSVATAMIPFLENDDANRALMGSNMQRQAVPLLRTQSPMWAPVWSIRRPSTRASACWQSMPAWSARSVPTASRLTRATTASTSIISSNSCAPTRAPASTRSPSWTWGSAWSRARSLPTAPPPQNGEIALGRNVLIGFMTWEGFNYEDAVLLNEKLVRDDIFTSIHIEEYEIEERDTKLAARKLPGTSPACRRMRARTLTQTASSGVGAEVHSGDILVGKITPRARPS